MKQYQFFTGLFFLEWMFFLILYPVWFHTKDFFELFTHYTLLLFFIFINLTFVYKILKNKFGDNKFHFSFSDFLDKNSLLIKNIFSDKKILFILVFSIPAIILHLYAASFPIQTWGDEAWHVVRGIIFFESFWFVASNYFSGNIFITSLILSLILVLTLRAKNIFRLILKTNKAYIMFFLVVLAFLYFYILYTKGIKLLNENEAFLAHQILIRHNPFGAVIVSLELTLFGFNELAVRLHSIIFSLLTSYYVYRLTYLYRTKNTSLLAALITLYIPAIFYFGNITYLDSGVVFFFTGASFYYLRYVKDGNFRDLILTGFMASLGFLYKDPLIMFLPVIWLFFILSIRKIADSRSEFINHIYLTWIFLAAALPWMLFTTLFRELKYEFVFTNVLDPQALTHWMRLFPSLITEPMFVLFILGFFYVLFTKKDSLSYFMLIWFSIIYLITLMENITFTKIVGNNWNFLNTGAGGRAVLPLLPVVSIIIATFIEEARKRVNIRFIYVSTIIFLYLSIFTFNFTLDALTWKSNGSYLTPKYASTTITPFYQHLPYDDVFQYLQQNTEPGTKIIAPIRNEPSGFYLRKYGLNDQIIIQTINLRTRKYATDDLFDYCIKNDIGYLLLFEWQVSRKQTNKDFLEKIRYEDKKFSPVKKFDYGNGSVYLYKIVV